MRSRLVYNGLIVTAFIANLTLNEDCYWINSRKFIFLLVNTMDVILFYVPGRIFKNTIYCRKVGVDQFYSNPHLLCNPLLNKDIAVSVIWCGFPGANIRGTILNITVKGKTLFLLTYDIFFCHHLCVNSNSASMT